MGILSGISIMSIYLISLEYLHQQLRKEKRKNAYEMQKLLASNQRLKMVKPCFLYDDISLLFFFGGGGVGGWVGRGSESLLEICFPTFGPFVQVLQRKTEEASAATKRLRELIESRKALSRRSAGWEI